MTATDTDRAVATLIADLHTWGNRIRRERLAGERPAPRVAAEVWGRRQVRVTCPYCGRAHLHGIAGGAGHRIAHCGRGGYVLALTESTTTTKGTQCHASS